jgi:predicted nucleic acid-binding protein
MSRGFLLDTNILSETLRPLRDAKVVAWLDSLSKDIQFVGVVVPCRPVEGARVETRPEHAKTCHVGQ